MRLLHQAAKQQHTAACGEPKGFTATVIKETCSTDFAFTRSCNRQPRIMASVQQHRLQQSIFRYSIMVIYPTLQVQYILHTFCNCIGRHIDQGQYQITSIYIYRYRELLYVIEYCCFSFKYNISLCHFDNKCHYLYIHVMYFK